MSVESGNELEHKDPHDDEEVTRNPKGPTSDRKAIVGVTAVLIFFFMLGTWVTYLVNDSWLMAVVVVVIPLAVGYIIHRRNESAVVLMGIFACSTVNAWFAYFYSPRLLTFALASIIMLGGIRSILLYARGTQREAILESFREIKRPKKVDSRLMMELHDNERFVLVTRTHPIDSAKWFVAMLVWTAVCAFFVTITLNPLALAVAYLVGLAFPAIKALLWEHERICLTNHFRLFVMKGIIKRSTPGTDARKLTDTTPETPRLSTILSWMRIIKVPYGSYRLENAGQDQALTVVGPIPKIDAFKRAISQMIASESDDQDD